MIEIIVRILYKNRLSSFFLRIETTIVERIRAFRVEKPEER